MNFLARAFVLAANVRVVPVEPCLQRLHPRIIFRLHPAQLFLVCRTQLGELRGQFPGRRFVFFLNTPQFLLLGRAQLGNLLG